METGYRGRGFSVNEWDDEVEEEGEREREKQLGQREE